MIKAKDFQAHCNVIREALLDNPSTQNEFLDQLFQVGETKFYKECVKIMDLKPSQVRDFASSVVIGYMIGARDTEGRALARMVGESEATRVSEVV